MKRKYWRCRDCKYHKSNNPKLPIGSIEEACETPKNTIVCYANDSLEGYCLVPKR